MTNRAISIKRVGAANNVMYNNVLIGCFEDGDTETLLAIMDKVIDTDSEKKQEQVIECMIDGCVKAVDVAWAMRDQGHSKSTVQNFIKTTFQLAR